ncbi:M15 family metallopeptidase [Vibrio sp. JC009]|uniref:M15 family metallopeptidase n=1 Tax=Vibrio sp. JC009 TaxID=2912314 RepID=UPI0023B0A51E|nr:M15 family metallopeptidase [Vibrio sp. JC009]WED21130.1 M15 family metallopeptidase [Vibrio sp. JC009]
MTPQELTGQTNTHLEEVETHFQTLLVHRQVSEDLIALVSAAKGAGFEMMIASGFRDYARQQIIWNRKFTGDTPVLDHDSQPLVTETLSDDEKISAILRWSALPGASRHHWGTDFDVYALNELPEDTRLALEPWEYHSGHQARFFVWLKQNLRKFGFFFPYAKDLGGVAPEPWHISHSSVSQACLQQFCVSDLDKALQNAPILGINSVRQNLDTIIVNYVINICPE